MEKAKVSVVIPVFNTQDYVAETLHSILEQNLEEIEILVIDDGSTDDSYQILKSLAEKDKRIQLYKQENKGQGAARNLGMKHAKGEYIYFMDSDDLLANDALHQCYEKCHGEQLDFLFFDAEVFGNEAIPIIFNYRRSNLINDEVYHGLDILKKLMDINGFQVPVWLNFIDLSYLRKNNLSFYEGIHHEDQLFTFLLFAYAGRVGRIDRTFFRRRIRPNSTMTSAFSRSKAESYFIIANYLLDLKETMNNPRFTSLVDRFVTDMMNSILYVARGMKVNDKSFVLFHITRYFWNHVTKKFLLLAAIRPLKNAVEN